MKTKLKEFKKIVREEFKRMLAEGDVDSERRRNYGYDEVDSGQGVEYHDLPESLEVEDADRLRRHADGYGDSEFDENIDEAPPVPKATGAAATRGQAFSKAVEPQQAKQKALALFQTIMQSGGNDPEVLQQIKTLAMKHVPGHPFSKMTVASNKSAAPQEASAPADDEKKKVGKSHAAPSSDAGRFPGPPAAESFDTVSGRDPKKSEPFDKEMHIPVHNMSHAEDVPLIDLDIEIEEESIKMPGLANVIEKKTKM